MSISISDTYQHHIDDEPTQHLQHKMDNVQSESDEKASATAIAKHQNWQTQSARIQSMVVQNDGSIILCDNEITGSERNDNSESRPRIEVVEILSPTNYIRGKDIFFKKEKKNKLFGLIKSTKIKDLPLIDNKIYFHQQPHNRASSISTIIINSYKVIHKMDYEFH